MPRRSLLSDTERDNLLVLPQSQDELIQQYSFTDADLALIRQRRGASNRLGFAVQLCLLRYPGYALAGDTVLPEAVITWIAKQVRSDAAAWPEYGEREKTRNEHLHELRAYLGLSMFGLSDFRKLVHSLADLAMQTDKAMVLAAYSLETLRQKHIILPALTVIERACAEAVTRANRRIYRALIDPLERHHKRSLDNLLNVAPDMSITWLVWLRQSPLKPNSRYMREHIERLKVFQSLALPEGLGRQIHQNRLLKMAREGAQMTPRDLAKFEDERRYATLAALAIEGMATVTDELVDLHDRIMVKLFSAAKKSISRISKSRERRSMTKCVCIQRSAEPWSKLRNQAWTRMPRSRRCCHGPILRKASSRPATWPRLSHSITCRWLRSSTARCDATRPNS